ncbi:hypothetical protein LMTR13_12825 [Bradyrhizobium icense]|uniref:Uncharacterized protein n=1 Tax=Bradyrhizobium icense TaxID=1274631 RepID=A0A1B1UDU3_9BRAD|nr:hypothetical protein LMTR13_12825 [Bradyrhizobium icense]
MAGRDAHGTSDVFPAELVTRPGAKQTDYRLRPVRHWPCRNNMRKNWMVASSECVGWADGFTGLIGAVARGRSEKLRASRKFS